MHDEKHDTQIICWSMLRYIINHVATHLLLLSYSWSADLFLSRPFEPLNGYFRLMPSQGLSGCREAVTDFNQLRASNNFAQHPTPPVVETGRRRV